MVSRFVSYAVALMLLVVVAPALAQLSISDRELLDRQHSGDLSMEDRSRLNDINRSQNEQAAKG